MNQYSRFVAPIQATKQAEFFWVPVIIAAATAAAQAKQAKEERESQEKQDQMNQQIEGTKGLADSITGFAGAADDSYKSQAEAIQRILSGF